MARERVPFGWALWIQWVLANTVGWIIGMVLSVQIGEFLEMFSVGAWIILSWGAVSMLAGLIMGMNQWFVLNLFEIPKREEWVHWWVLATVIGWVPSMVIVVGLGAGELLNYASSGAIIGMSVGITQWFVLRHPVPHAEWWPIISTIGWMAGMYLGDILPEAIGFALAGMISGIITGFCLILLLRKIEVVIPKDPAA